MSARSRRDTQGQRAARQMATWRAAGLALSITSEEAHALTDGAVGAPGDTTPINLSTVALRSTR